MAGYPAPFGPLHHTDIFVFLAPLDEREHRPDRECQRFGNALRHPFLLFKEIQFRQSPADFLHVLPFLLQVAYQLEFLSVPFGNCSNVSFPRDKGEAV